MDPEVDKVKVKGEIRMVMQARIARRARIARDVARAILGDRMKTVLEGSMAGSMPVAATKLLSPSMVVPVRWACGVLPTKGSSSNTATIIITTRVGVRVTDRTASTIR